VHIKSLHIIIIIHYALSSEPKMNIVCVWGLKNAKTARFPCKIALQLKKSLQQSLFV